MEISRLFAEIRCLPQIQTLYIPGCKVFLSIEGSRYKHTFPDGEKTGGFRTYLVEPDLKIGLRSLTRASGLPKSSLF